MIDMTKFRRAASNWTRQTRTHEPRNPRRAGAGAYSAPDAAAETARTALCRLSSKLRAARATGQIPPALADCETINDCLRRMYQIQSRQTDFDTFSGWRARGYAVDKGARGWPIWSRPKGRRDAETPEETEAATEAAETAPESERKSFWVAYLFHAGQVHNRATQSRPATYRAAELPALPLPADYAADLHEIRNAEDPQPADIENNPPLAPESVFEILEDGNPEPQPEARAQSAGKTAARALEALYKAKSSDKFRPQFKYPYCDAAAGEIFASDGIRLVRVNSAAIPELAQLPSGFFDIIKDGRKHKIGLAGPDAAENPVNFRGAIPDLKSYSRIEIGARNPDGGKKKAGELANEVNAILLRDFDTLVNLKFIKDAIGSAPQDFTLYAPPDNRQPVALEDKTGALLSVIMPIYNPKK